MRTLKAFLLLAGILAWAVRPALADQKPAVPVSNGDVRFSVDHAAFRDPSGKTREFISCEIGYDQLLFMPQGKGNHLKG